MVSRAKTVDRMRRRKEEERNILLRENPDLTDRQALAQAASTVKGRKREQERIRKLIAAAAAKKQARAYKGGMPKRNANIDYRKSGMFYVGGMSAKPTPINKGKK